ncbi:MAG: hypothetical protein KZQ76_03525 [Candidatus Thiodiazotropha sp. (ex Epidulcina cf. delphinae)]|nr:hypothetical protein [Candidatus Thiodiazotropha sp. (ex Epidulcina cf. delphinae)]
MQISNSLTLSSLPQSPEQPQERSAHAQQMLPPASQTGIAKHTLRSVEDIKQAERLLKQRQGSDHSFARATDDPRKQRAVSTYQSVQRGRERDYVSEVLGIDVYT